jgi:hypothetical protein
MARTDSFRRQHEDLPAGVARLQAALETPDPATRAQEARSALSAQREERELDPRIDAAEWRRGHANRRPRRRGPSGGRSARRGGRR